MYMYVPHHIPRKGKVRPGHSVYRSREITKCATKKRRLWRELKYNPCNSYTRTKYRDCAHQHTSLIQQHETSVEKRIVDAN